MKKPEPAMTSTMKPAAPAAPAAAKASASTSTQVATMPASAMKKTAMELFRISKAEVKLADIAAATGATVMDKPELKPTSDFFAELLASAQPSVRLGLLCKCYINGCDVHMINEEKQIVAHFPSADTLPPGFQEARHLVARMPQKYLALVVYTDKTEALLPDGSTIKFP
ncbi:hypothetical protein BH10BDE1_BH10BDE1_16880 [soil metagenome]